MKSPTCILAACICLWACRKPYNPPAIAGTAGYLVVEGVNHPGSDSTTINLSYTVNIASNVTVNPASGAAVSIQSDQNLTYPLIEGKAESYMSPGLNLDQTRQYRLSIKTSDGKQYYSDFVPVITTPPIDSVGFNVASLPGKTGIQIYVNTLDAFNTTKYYRWDYSEEWIFYTKYISDYIVIDGAPLNRQPNQYITFCYAGDPSSTVILGSSAKLSQNVIYQAPTIFIPSTAEKIEERYSILVHQYALTSDACAFYTNLRKNTENLGSIFDAQPSSLPGNIHCTNPAAPAIGYVTVSTGAEKGIFINKNQLPGWVPDYPYTCQQDMVGGQTGITLADISDYPGLYLVTFAISKNSQVAYYMYTSRACADCTIPGTLTPPPYWK